MSCPKFEDELFKYYFGEEDDKPKASEYIKLQTHIRACPDCSVASEQLKGIQAALNGIIRQKTSATFYDNLSEKFPKPSSVKTFFKSANKKITGIHKYVWYALLGLVFLIGLVFAYRIIFATYNLPMIYHSGDIDYRKSSDTGGWKKLGENENIQLANGDKVKTDDSATAIFAISEDMSIKMSEKTEIKVMLIQRAGENGFTCKISLVEGLIWVSQPGQGDLEKQKLEVSTENAIIETLGGGDFDVYYSDNNRTVLRVFKGKARFYHIHFQEEKSTISAGQSSLTSSDQPPTSPAEMDLSLKGGWEEWNLNMALSGNLMTISPSSIKDKIGTPKSWIQLQVTPPPENSGTPSPTPGVYDPYQPTPVPTGQATAVQTTVAPVNQPTGGN